MKKFLDVYNPYSNKIIKTIKCDDKKSVNKKLKNIKKLNWSSKQKESFFNRVKKELVKQKINLANLIVSEVGVSYIDAIFEVERSIICADISSKILKKINKNFHSKFLIKQKDEANIDIFEEPMKLMFGITPFNLPLVLAIHKIFPAIIADVPIIFKPSEKTPLSSLNLLKLLSKCGLKKNFLETIVTNDPKLITQYIINHSNVDCVSFTGSSRVGLHLQKILSNSKNSLKKYIPELGGCSSLIICEDSNLELAIKIVIDGCFKYSGQRCTSVRRVIVDNKIANKFIKKLVIQVKKLNFGNPEQKTNHLGALIDRSALNVVTNRIRKSIKNGSKLKYGNIIKGNSLSPTILDHVKLNMEIVSKETFGPICAIIRSKNIENSIKLANQTTYQMACGLITNNKNYTKKILSEVRVGQLSINGAPGYRNESAPFGGFGDSGNGEKEGIYLATKSLKHIRVVYNHKI